MPTSLVATVLRALGQSPTEMEIHEIIIKVFFTKYLSYSIIMRMYSNQPIT